jgi:Tol biopolymer transport system component
VPLKPGVRLGPYEVLSAIGAGGMGEVYRSRDTTLNREVALKILPTAFALDPDRLARFKREAQVLASLNHPNIAAIYGFEESRLSGGANQESVQALVLELVDGPTLAERIERGAIPNDEAWAIARQIADALEAAHEQGIIHRDLKPANIKVRTDGTVKVLDFGLAKALEPLSADAADVTASPTITSPAMTRMGIILGTAAYMSPEQAQGKPADKRADIWAFGVVLHEMLTGRRLFSGETVSETLASVLIREPVWDGIPLKAQPLLRRCLTKDPKRRLRDIGDAMALLEMAPEPVAAVAAPARSPRTAVLWGAAAALAAMVTGGGWWTAWRSTRPMDHPLMRLSVDLGPTAVAGEFSPAAISPDGTRLVFSVRGPDGKEQLATRLLDQSHITLLAGTEGATAPFFKPDGQWIGFFARGKLRKVSVSGGGVFTLCDAPDGRGASWGEDDAIITTLNSNTATGLSRVPAAGGTPQDITYPGQTGEATHRWPQILPGGRAVLFMGNKTASNYDDSSIEVLSLTTGRVKVVQPGGYFPRYLATSNGGGYLVYVNHGTLLGVPFDLDRLEVRGTPTPLLEDVAGNTGNGGGRFDVSRTGTFVYSSGKASAGAWTLAWLDSGGKTRPMLTSPGIYDNPRLSPDGKRLAFSNNPDIEVYDLEHETTTQLTFTTQTRTNHNPVWTADGKHIAFVAESNSDFSLLWIRADGSGEAQLLLQSKYQLRPRSFSGDGTRLTFDELTPETGFNLWTLPLEMSDPDHPKAGKPEVFLRTPFSEQRPALSADGRWVAYTSNESGRSEVFVRPFPPGPGKWLISTGEGSPMWSRDGKELFYRGADDRIMAATCTVNGDSFACAKPRPWSSAQIPNELDLAPDGKRFVIKIRPQADSAGESIGSVHITFLLNFFDEVRRRIPAAQ